MLKRKFAVVKLWEDILVAEDENIFRIQRAAQDIGVECIVVDRNYEFINIPGRFATAEEFDFVIHLHFESVKINSLFSFVALWNPLQFYHEWGYQKYSNALLTHDDFLSCSSKAADDHVARICHGNKAHLKPFFTFYHSTSYPILKPKLGVKKVHYCGINWERVGKSRGRHADLLEFLDQRELVDIYGPQKMHGVKVWDGFRCYRGAVPFDGSTMIETINEAGISLVLSSDAHVESELMSNRLFESAAAGAIVIADENPFTKKYFGDSVLYIDKNCDPADLTYQVLKHLRWISENSDEALVLAQKSQNIFLEKFELRKSIQNIYEQFLERKKSLHTLVADFDDRLSVCCIVDTYQKDNFSRLEENIVHTLKYTENLYVYVDDVLYRNYQSGIDKVCQSPKIKIIPFAMFKRDTRTEKIIDSFNRGKIVENFLSRIDDYSVFSIIDQRDVLFEKHYGVCLAHIKDVNVDSVCIRSTYKHIADGKFFFDASDSFLEDLRNKRYVSLGRFVFSKQVYIDTYMFTLPYLKNDVLSYFLAMSKKIKDVRAYTQINDIIGFEWKVNQHDFTLIRDIVSDISDCTDIFHGVYSQNTESSFNVKELLEMRTEDKVSLVVDLFHSFPLPRFIKSAMLWLNRKLLIQKK